LQWFLDVPVQKGRTTANFYTVLRICYQDGISRHLAGYYSITQGKTCRLDYIRFTWITIIINYTIIENKSKKCCVTCAKPQHISWINEKYLTLDMMAT
jgi:hypothetical protein